MKDAEKKGGAKGNICLQDGYEASSLFDCDCGVGSADRLLLQKTGAA